jgi:hypothetical protein
VLCCLGESPCDNNCQHSDSDGEESEHLIDEEEHESDITLDMNGFNVTNTDLHNEDLHGDTNGEEEAESDGHCGGVGDHDEAEIKNGDRKYSGVTILVEERKVDIIPDSPLSCLGMDNQFPAGEIILKAEKLNET